MKTKTQHNATYSYSLIGLLIGLGLLAIIVFLGLVVLDQPISFDLFVTLFRDNPIIWVALLLPIILGFFGYYVGNEFYKKTNDLREDINNEQKKAHEIFDFVEKIRLGQTDAQYEIREGDEIGKALINLRDALKKSNDEENARKEEEKQRHWITEGIAKFGAILRENIGDLKKLSNVVTMELVKYINAHQAGFFILEEKDGKKYFNETAAYAKDATKDGFRRKYADKQIEWGEGLIGACAIEKKTNIIPRTSENYVRITSGLGGAPPRSLVIVPLKSNDEIYGVVEIASFNEYKPYEIEFIERVAESIASTISNVNINLRTAQLLTESQEQAKIMARQEEDMRRNMEELKHTQFEAAKQSEQFISFTNSVNHTMIRAEYSVDGYLLYANSKFLNKLGYTNSSEIEGKHISMFISDKDRAWFNELWQNLASGGKHFEGDMKHVTKTGTDVWTMATYVSVRDHERKPIKILFLGIDITDSKKQSLDYKGQIDALNRSTMKAEYGPDGRVLEMNHKLVEILQFTPEELTKRTIFNFLTSSDLDEFKIIWKNIINGVPFEGRHKWFTKTGEERWFQGTYTVVHDMYGEPAKIVFIGNDITEQIHMEDKSREQTEILREQEQKLQQSKVELSKKLKETREEMKLQFREVEIVKILSDKTLEGMLDAVVVINQDNKIQLFNRAAEELWGVQRDEILGKDISSLLPTDSVSENENYLGNFFKANDTTLISTRTEVFILDKFEKRTNVLVTLSEASIGERYTLTAFIQKIEVELF
ncbi:MAG: PAS domain S-box protein [Bacteroidales bacterium]|nr:PAS domain S-box protein [Bacteroidales bacterium]